MKVTRFSINLWGKQKIESIPVFGFGTYALEQGGPKARWYHGKAEQLVQREDQLKAFVDAIGGQPFILVVPTKYLTMHFCPDTIYSSIDLYGIMTNEKDDESKQQNAVPAPRISGSNGIQVGAQISVNANQCASDAELMAYNPIGIIFSFDVKKSEPAKKSAPVKGKK
jgi:hypothetical protein